MSLYYEFESDAPLGLRGAYLPNSGGRDLDNTEETRIWLSDLSHRVCRQQLREVGACNEELEFIRNHFQHLRMTDARYVTWTGDDARFVIINLDILLKK